MRGLVVSVLGLMLSLPGVAPAGNLLVSWRVNSQQETSRDEAGLRQGEVVIDSRRGVVSRTEVRVNRSVRTSQHDSNQSVLVMNGGQARLFFGRSVPVSTWQFAWQGDGASATGALGAGTTSSSTNPPAWALSQTHWVDLGEGLTVRPRWPGGSALVTVELEASSRRAIAPGEVAVMESSGGYEPDGQSRRTEVMSTVAVPLGQWVAVARRGGQTQQRQSGTWSTRQVDSDSQEQLEIRISLP